MEINLSLSFLNKESIMTNIIIFLFIIVFCFIGAIVKDTYNTLIDKDEKVSIIRILISTIVSSIILFSLSDYILRRISYKLLTLFCFLGGMLGFEILGKISKLEFWKNSSEMFKKIKKILRVLEEDDSSNDEIDKK